MMLIASFALGFLAVSLFRLHSTKQYIFDSASKVPPTEVAIVLGAKVFKNGTMSDMLTDRTLTALELYQTGKVGKILTSGDHGRTDYDEVNAMKNFLLERGAKPEDFFWTTPVLTRTTAFIGRGIFLVSKKP